MTPTLRQYLAGLQVIGILIMVMGCEARAFAFLAFMGVLIPLLDTREYKI